MTPTARRRPPATRLVAVALLALSLLGVLGAGRASAQTDSADGPTLTLVQQTPWVGPDGVFQVVVRPDGLPAGATVRAELYERIYTRTALADAIDGDVGTRIFVSTASPVTELDPAGDGTVVVRLPVSTGASTEPGGVQLDRTPGMYPFVVQFYDADGVPIAALTTILLRLGEPVAPDASTNRMAVGVTMRLEAGVTPGADGVPTLEPDASDALTATIGVVAAHPEVPLTLAPSPQSLALLEAEGTAGTAAVGSLGTRVARQVLAAPYAPIDSGAWVAAGLSDELAEQHRAGSATLTSLLASQPDPSIALVDPTVTPESLAAQTGLGVTSVVVPSAQLDPVTGRSDDTFAEQFAVPSANGGTVRGVVGDDIASLRLALTPDPVLAGHLALAELAMIHLADPSSARGVAVSVLPSTDPAALTAFLDGLADIDGASSGSAGEAMVSPVTLTDLFATTSTAETTRNGRTTTLERTYRTDPPADLGTYPTDLRSARQSLAGLQSLVPQSPEVVAPVTATVLGSGSRSLDAGQRDTVLAAATSQIGAVTGQIVVAPDQVVTLTSSSGKVPLNIENRLTVPARVRLVLQSAKLDFPEGAVVEQDLAPAQTTQIALPVETRASGAFPFDVAIISADGTLPVASTTYTVRSTAISGVGLVLSVGAGLFLLVWWARHWRTSRRARKLVGSNHPALSGDEPDGYAPPDRSSAPGAADGVTVGADTRPAATEPEPTSPDPLEGR